MAGDIVDAEFDRDFPPAAKSIEADVSAQRQRIKEAFSRAAARAMAKIEEMRKAGAWGVMPTVTISRQQLDPREFEKDSIPLDVRIAVQRDLNAYFSGAATAAEQRERARISGGIGGCFWTKAHP